MPTCIHTYLHKYMYCPKHHTGCTYPRQLFLHPTCTSSTAKALFRSSTGRACKRHGRRKRVSAVETMAKMTGIHLNTSAAGNVRMGDDEPGSPLTCRSSLRSAGSRPGSSRRSSRGQARVSLNEKAFKGRQDGAINLFPNPLFDNSNGSLVYTDRSARTQGSQSARQHGGASGC